MKYRKIKSLKFLYEISNNGELRNVKSKKVLKTHYDKDGYVKVTIENGSIKKYCSIHRLVAEAWCNPPDNFEELQVNHKDYNVKNNYYKNLEWVTCKENIEYSQERRTKAIRESKLCNGNINNLIIHRYKYKIKELNLTFEKSEDAAKYLVDNYLIGKNVLTVARKIRYAANNKKHYAYGYHILKL